MTTKGLTGATVSGRARDLSRVIEKSEMRGGAGAFLWY